MKKILILAAALPLAACIRFGAEPPEQLLTLNAAATIPLGQTVTSSRTNTITIAPPAVPQELAVNRIPVRATDTSIAYVKDAQWVEPPARLFTRLLSDTVAAQTGRAVRSRRQSNVDPGAQLSGELRSFGVDAATSEAVVVYDAALLRDGATGFEKRRFEARVPVATVDATNVGAALNQAANRVAADVAGWLGR